MTMKRLTVGVVTGAVGIGVLVPVASAGAATASVRDAIATVEKTFKSNKDFTYVEAHASKLTTKAQLKAALPRVKAVGKLYTSAAAYVAKASTSTSTEKTAQVAWVNGAKLAGQEYASLAVEFTDVLAGNVSGAKAAEKKALGIARRATVDIDKADKLLGLPKGA